MQHEKQADGQVVVYERQIKGDEMHCVSYQTTLDSFKKRNLLIGFYRAESFAGQFGGQPRLPEDVNIN